LILNVLRTSLQNLKRDRGGLLLTFVLPIAFFSIFAVVFGGSRQTTRKIRIALVDLDASPRSQKFAAAVRAESALRVVDGPEEENSIPYDVVTAEAAVREGKIPVALIIPKGFGSAPIGFTPGADRPTVQLLADTSDPIAPPMVDGLIQKIVMTSMPTDLASAGVTMLDAMSGGLSTEQRASIETSMAQIPDSTAAAPSSASAGSTPAVAGSEGASDGGLIRIESKDVLGEKKANPVVAFYAAGIGVMFLLFTATGASGALLEEQESGTLDRVLSTHVSMTTLLAGKLFYLAALAMSQLILMFTWGAIVFGVELREHLAGFVIMAIVTSLAAASFGILMATLCRTRAQLGALSTLLVLIISAVGGSMIPRFMMPESIQKFSFIFFNSWALEGFLKVFWREEPLRNLAPEVAVLLGTTVLFMLLARRFASRWDIT